MAMPREDYLRRLIVEMGRMWSRIVGLIKARQLPAARAMVDQAFQQVLGLPPEDARTLSPHELIARLMIGETPDAGRDKCCAMAALFGASGDIAAAEQDADASADFDRKALEILLTILARTPDFAPPDYTPTVAELVERLSMYELPLETNLLLMRYYEQTGAYAKAEDVLFEMLDAAPGALDLLAAGRAFYERLRHQSDPQLAAGDLTRAEVEAGIAELKRYTPD
jgi:uncharacterized protein DUF6483